MARTRTTKKQQKVTGVDMTCFDAVYEYFLSVAGDYGKSFKGVVTGVYDRSTDEECAYYVECEFDDYAPLFTVLGKVKGN